MATAVLIPISDYLASDNEPDAEYVDGEVELRPMGEFDHATWAQAIERWFMKFEQTWSIRVRCELRVQVSATRFRVPDVVVWSRERPKERILTHPPIAVFEVLSPEDTISRLLVRLDDYAAMGIRNIFMIDPDKERAFQYIAGDLRLCPARVALDGTVGHLDWNAIAALRDV